MLPDRLLWPNAVLAAVVVVVLLSPACSKSEPTAPSSSPPASSSSLLTVRPTGTGSGTVSMNPAGPYRAGDTVVLTAVPGQSSVFAGWTAPCPTTQPPPLTCTLTLTATAVTIIAQFDLN